MVGSGYTYGGILSSEYRRQYNRQKETGSGAKRTTKVEVVRLKTRSILTFYFVNPIIPNAMPGLGPSLVFAAGLAIGVGAGTLLPKKGKSEGGVLPPPPVEKYDVVKRVPTAGGSAVLQGGFPGTYILSSTQLMAKKKDLPRT